MNNNQLYNLIQEITSKIFVIKLKSFQKLINSNF